jgi:DNA-binding NtrC family response regulator
MILKICLLVTDDPDDHQVFSEAMAEILPDTIVVSVLNAESALRLLRERKLVPDYIFVDLTTYGMDASVFLNSLKTDTSLKNATVVVYGEDEMLGNGRQDGFHFFSKDYDYGELRSFLKRILKRQE